MRTHKRPVPGIFLEDNDGNDLIEDGPTCSSCNTQAAEGDVYCSACGAPLKEDDEADGLADPNDEEGGSSVGRSRKKGRPSDVSHIPHFDPSKKLPVRDAKARPTASRRKEASIYTRSAAILRERGDYVAARIATATAKRILEGKPGRFSVECFDKGDY